MLNLTYPTNHIELTKTGAKEYSPFYILSCNSNKNWLTFLIEQAHPLHSDRWVWDYPLCTLRGHRYNFLNYDAFLTPKFVFI